MARRQMFLLKSADQALVHIPQAIWLTAQPSSEVLRHRDVVLNAPKGISLLSQMPLEIL